MQCAKVVDPGRVWVATDDLRIVDACETYGVQTIMTSSACLTGTDRVAEAAEKLDLDVAINVQGDEPVFNPDDIRLLVGQAMQSPRTIFNGMCPITREDQWLSRSTPKVVTRQDGRLLYMSRSPIPGSKHPQFSLGWRQVCAYAFPRQALRAFTAVSEKTTLESIEDIEILRFLELGHEVQMLPMSDQSVSVDHPEDISVAEQAIAALGY